MKKKQLLPMNLQMFAQTWDPDNVLVYETKEGKIPDKYNTLILSEVMENSKIMQLAKYEEMTDKEKKFEYFAEGPGAYWVGEGEKINIKLHVYFCDLVTIAMFCLYHETNYKR